MKYTLAFIFIISALFANAQNYKLDTIQLKNFTLRAADWSYAIGQFYFQRSDTVANDFVDQYRAKAKATPVTSGFNTPITVDSIPGHIAFKIYTLYQTAPAGEIIALGTNISTVIHAVTGHPVFISAVNDLDAIVTQSYQTKRNDGKRFVTGL